MESAALDIPKILAAVLAPVFLITGIAALISPMTLRYGRVIDRARHLLREAGARPPTDARLADEVRSELAALYRRARLLRTALIAAVVAVTLVVVTICLLFGSMAFGVATGSAAIVSFAVALGALIAALVVLTLDFAVSLRVLKTDIRHWVGSKSDRASGS